MATLSEINDRVRLELGDLPQAFTESFTGDGVSTVWNLNVYPVEAPTVVVKVDGITVSASVEERTGRLVLAAAPASNASIVVTGTHYRYFSCTDLSAITTEAMDLHLNNRTDEYGRAVTLATMPTVEMYPAALMGTIQALWALATDASFDIDISTPDGVTIPRSERFRQLMEMIEARQQQYTELTNALGIGLYRLEVFTLRRISKGTGRYVPVYTPREVDDYSAPTRVYLPLPSYGSKPAEEAHSVHDITLTRGDAFEITLDFDFDITHFEVSAQARTVPDSPILAAQFAVTVLDAALGTVKLSLTPDQTSGLPLRSYWDVEVQSLVDPDDVLTMLGGVLVAQKDVTRA